VNGDLYAQSQSNAATWAAVQSGQGHVYYAAGGAVLVGIAVVALAPNPTIALLGVAMVILATGVFVSCWSAGVTH
jgi:hypothetical protein